MSTVPGPRRQVVVFSGGSAANSLVDVFNSLLTLPSSSSPDNAVNGESKGSSTGNGRKGWNGEGGVMRKLSYIIGISDNGGSTSEILRVFGGPGIGDVRSRLIRLVPAAPEGAREREQEEKLAIKQLLNHRLPASDTEAREEWLEIVDGTSEYWKKISSEKRELIRSFLIHLNAELLKRARPPTSTFNFHSASIGNLFLTGCRIFFGSFESAIYLFRSITGIPEHTQVIPAINSNFAHHIAAGLADGTVIIGQNQISHPSATNAANLQPSSENIYSTVPSGAATPLPSSSPFSPLANGVGVGVGSQFYLHQHQYPHGIQFNPQNLHLDYRLSQHAALQHNRREEEDDLDSDGVEDANLPGSHPSLRTKNIIFEKDNEPELPSRIERIWYINPYGQEIRPPANPKVVRALQEAEAVIFSIGSLYTSIIPCLILRGIGHALSSPIIPYKILILNGSLDRETGPLVDHTYSSPSNFSASDFIRAIVRACIDSQSRKLPPPIHTTAAASVTGLNSRAGRNPTSLWIQPAEVRKYVTHVVYLKGEGTPYVDLEELRSWGVMPVCANPEYLEGSGEGREVVEKVTGKGKSKGMYYEEENLRMALVGILSSEIKA